MKERQEGLKETLENVDILSYDHPVAETLITPDLQVLDQFVKMIDDAQERVWIQIYIFTEKRLRQAVVNAHRR